MLSWVCSLKKPMQYAYPNSHTSGSWYHWAPPGESAPSITCLALIPDSSRASGWQQVGHVLQVDTLRSRLRLFSMNRNPDESDAGSASKNLLRAWAGGLGENEYMYMYG